MGSPSLHTTHPPLNMKLAVCVSCLVLLVGTLECSERESSLPSLPSYSSYTFSPGSHMDLSQTEDREEDYVDILPWLLDTQTRMRRSIVPGRLSITTSLDILRDKFVTELEHRNRATNYRNYMSFRNRQSKFQGGNGDLAFIG